MPDRTNADIQSLLAKLMPRRWLENGISAGREPEKKAPAHPEIQAKPDGTNRDARSALHVPARELGDAPLRLGGPGGAALPHAAAPRAIAAGARDPRRRPVPGRPSRSDAAGDVDVGQRPPRSA